MLVTGYTDLTLSRAGIWSSFLPGPCWGARFRLNADVALLFPYIKGTVRGARLYAHPDHIKFELDGVHCTLYPDEAVAAAFADRHEGERFARRLIDFLNDLYAKKDALTPNHKLTRPVPVFDLYKLLPQTNCKACGFASCLAFAGALSKGQTSRELCPGFSSPLYETAVYPVYAKDGTLAATVALDIDPASPDCLNNNKAMQPEPENLPAKKPAEHGHAEAPPALTRRETEVLRLMAAGATNIEIAESLAISPHTVKSHVVHVFDKLGVNDRTQAAVRAVRHRLI